MNGGDIQQIGTPEDIYNEPKNAFVADFIGESNIMDGVMHERLPRRVLRPRISPAWTRALPRTRAVEVVVRPEDIEVVSRDGRAS